MANFRNFTIYNRDTTESIDLNSFEGYLVTTPTGIGVYFKNSYFDIGGKRILTEQKSAYKDISLIVDIFAPTRVEIEKKYNNIRNFIARNRAGGFRLAYKPYDNAQERYIECDIKDFDKSEKTTSRMMTVPLTVEPRTFWRVDGVSDSVVQSEEELNTFSFDLDENFDGLTKYDVRMTNQIGKQEVVIPGYDKRKLPDGFSFFVTVTDTETQGITRKYGGYITLGDLIKESDGVYLAKKRLYQRGDRIVEAAVHIDFNRDSFAFEIIPEKEFTVDDPNRTYTVDVGMSRYSVLKVEFTNEETILADKTVLISYNGGGLSNLGAEAEVKGGSKIWWKNLGKYAEMNYVVVKRHYIARSGSASNYSWSIEGSLYCGTQNYMKGFLLDDTISDFYNIAMFRGASAMNEFTNDGDTETPLLVRIHGRAVNPSIRLIPKGETAPIQTTKLNLVIPDGAYAEIDSDPESTGAWIYYNDNSKANILSRLDQNSNMFLTLPRGSYFLQVLDEDGNEVLTTVFYKREYIGA